MSLERTDTCSSVTQAAGTGLQATTVYQYDELGNEIAQTDAAGRTTSFQYDALGHRIGRTLPGGQSESFGYDSEGNQIYQTNFNGVVITNQYDLGNRLTSQASVNGYNVSYAYSATGLRTNMVDASGVTHYLYDAMSRLTNKVAAFTNGPTLALNYAYSTNGSLTALWSGSANGVTNAYAYDLQGRLTNVLANGSAAAGYGFDVAGNLQSLAYGNGVTNLCQYDALNRLTNQVWNLHGTPLARYVYTLGPTGNRTALAETNNGTVRSYNWAYDSLYRLTQETLTGGTSGTLTYGYDVVGNRTNRASNLSVLTNQNNTFTVNDWLSSDDYDLNGNTISSSGNTYQYDALNHATKVNTGGILLAYDGDGNRARKTVSATGPTTYYLLDEQNPSGYVQVLEEWTSTGGSASLNRVYNYGMDLISQRVPGSSTNYFIFDGHGSTRLLVDIGGNVQNAFAYDAYGTLLASNTASQTAYLYCGQQFDSDLGFYYNRARYMSQNTGRFWTMDTTEGNNHDPLSLHKFIYSQDDSVNNADPSGHDSISAGIDLSSLIFQYIINNVLSLEPTAPASPGTRSKIAQIANKYADQESQKWLDTPYNKCNLFVYDVLTEAGCPPPKIGGALGYYAGMFGGIAHFRRYAPLAGQWADKSVIIPGWDVVAGGPNSAEPGDVIAQKIDWSDASGHCGIVAGPKQTASADSLAAPAGTIRITDFGFRSDSDKQAEGFGHASDCTVRRLH